MDISIGVVAAENASTREVAELTNELRAAIGRLKDVSAVNSIEVVEPGAKGIGQALGAFLVTLPTSVLPGLMDLLKSVVLRPSQPPVTIEMTTSSSKVSFDPRTIKTADLAALCEELRPKTTTG